MTLCQRLTYRQSVSELTARRQEEKDRRRNEILDAAAESAAESGFDAITMVREMFPAMGGK